MPSLGEQLRAQRERKNITLEQAAADTRIREKFLKALEEGDYPSLPGAVYTRGFLRNYSDYLDLETDVLVTLFQKERLGAPPEPAPKRNFKAYRPIVHQSLIFRPIILVPVIVIVFVGLFVGYLYYQFSTFAVKPRLEITQPATDLVVTSGDLVVRGITVAEGRLTVSVIPGPDIIDLKPDADGHFSVAVALKPGANHIEAEILDMSGKTNRVSRTIQYQAQPTSVGPAPQLVVDQPGAGVTLTNVSVLLSGRVDRSVTRLLVNNIALPVGSDGTFQSRYYLPAGPQSFRIVAQTASGGTVEETRNVVVVYTAAVVNVFVRGGDTWMLATIDGTDVPGSGRIYRDGESATFQGKEVRLRAANGAVAQVIYNGQLFPGLGKPGEVVDRVFAVQ